MGDVMGDVAVECRPRFGLVLFVSLALTLTLGLVGCASEDAIPGSSGGCSPGAVVGCYCIDGTQSTQLCGESGTGYQPCNCSAANVPPAVISLPQDTATAAGSDFAQTPADAMTETGEMNPADTQEPMDVVEPAPVVDGAEVPATDSCAAAADWDPAWSAFEDEVLVLVNQRRSMGASCGAEGQFGAAPPLTMNAELRCAARLHSMDMGVNNYFAHASQDGSSFTDRTEEAGYSGGLQGENIASGAPDPASVVEGWMGSDGHCANIMLADFTEIGIGYWQGVSDGGPWSQTPTMWTQDFGAPGFGGGGGQTAGCPGNFWC